MRFLIVMYVMLSFFHVEAVAGSGTSRGVSVYDCKTILSSSPYRSLVSHDFNVPKVIFVTGPTASGKTFTFIYGLGVFLSQRYGSNEVKYLDTLMYGAELRGENGNRHYPDNAQILVLDNFYPQYLDSLDEFLVDRLLAGKTTFVILKGIGYLIARDKASALLDSKKESLTSRMASSTRGTNSSFEILNISFE